MNWWQAALWVVAILTVTALSFVSIPSTLELYRTFDVGS